MTVVLDEEAFTVTATSQDSSVLDASQYLDGGPCVHSAFHQREVSVPDVLNEERRQFYEHAADSRPGSPRAPAPVVFGDARHPP